MRHGSWQLAHGGAGKGMARRLVSFPAHAATAPAGRGGQFGQRSRRQGSARSRAGEHDRLNRSDMASFKRGSSSILRGSSANLARLLLYRAWPGALSKGCQFTHLVGRQALPGGSADEEPVTILRNHRQS